MSSTHLSARGLRQTYELGAERLEPLPRLALEKGAGVVDAAPVLPVLGGIPSQASPAGC